MFIRRCAVFKTPGRNGPLDDARDILQFALKLEIVSDQSELRIRQHLGVGIDITVRDGDLDFCDEIIFSFFGSSPDWTGPAFAMVVISG